MGHELTLATRRDITKKEAQSYAKASKKEKGVILDRMTTEIGWSRANARRQLQHALQRRGPATSILRKPRGNKYTYDARLVLQHVYLTAGKPCGKYLSAAMRTILDNLERHVASGSLGKVRTRYTPQVRDELLRMSPATIDRYLAPFKDRLHPDAKAATRTSKNRFKDIIPIMTHIKPIDHQPGIVMADTVAHCGHTLKGEFAFTLTVTDPFTGRTINTAVKNKASKWIAEALEETKGLFPYEVDRIHTDNGSEFLNASVQSWVKSTNLRATRSRPRHSNDNPFVEQKNGDIVRKDAFYYRYDTPRELAVLKALWPLVNLRKNLFTPTTKAVGYKVSRSGRQVRSYDAPRTPADRVKSTGVMLPPERDALEQLYRETNLAELTRRIHQLQLELIRLAEAKTQAQVRKQVKAS
ncbi:integrase catalytic domain-containing protein [Glutamicibacter uratoxydans]|uniref:integrase catalytic domain-containing protein n=1 Tax=Glutamicibacter uratoxydans TaxID=43667 RepID=UPI003D6DFE85